MEGARLITEQEATKLASAVTPQELSDGLDTKVTAVANQRLITEQEATKLASAVTPQEFRTLFFGKDTGDLEEIMKSQSRRTENISNSLTSK